MVKKNLIYVSYDGMTDSLGESQVLSYLIKNKDKMNIYLYSFEKPERSREVDRINKICVENNIAWNHFRYTRKPKVFSTLYDMFLCYKVLSKKIKGSSTYICHARSYIPGIIALLLKKRFSIPFIFDMRGWLIDENLEQGSWSSAMYKPVVAVLRFFENKMIKNADYIITLTECAKKILIEKYSVNSSKIEVIPTCVDFSKFYYSNEERIKIRQDLKLSSDAFVLIYSGSVGGYYNIDEMISLFCELKKIRDNAVMLFLTTTPKDEIIQRLPESIINNIIVTQTELRNVYKYLSAADAGLILYDDTFSGTGRSPTKLAEYWATGLKVIAPAGIGDLDFFFSDRVGGIQFKTFNGDSYRKALLELLQQKDTRESIINKSKQYFDVTEGALKQMKIYEAL